LAGQTSVRPALNLKTGLSFVKPVSKPYKANVNLEKLQIAKLNFMPIPDSSDHDLISARAELI
jgi:hypothetical protein